jgi:hypothetical protein
MVGTPDTRHGHGRSWETEPPASDGGLRPGQFSLNPEGASKASSGTGRAARGTRGQNQELAPSSTASSLWANCVADQPVGVR